MTIHRYARSKRNHVVREGCIISFARIQTGEVYGWIMMSAGLKYNGKSNQTSFSFRNADSYEEKYLKGTEWQRKQQGWPHAPKSWRKLPDIKAIMKRAGIIEIPHRSRAGIMEFDIEAT